MTEPLETPLVLLFSNDEQVSEFTRQEKSVERGEERRKEEKVLAAQLKKSGYMILTEVIEVCEKTRWRW